MTWHLFLDDERDAGSAYDTLPPASVVVCASVNRAGREITSRGLPETMSLDHDLGLPGEDGNFFIDWLIYYDLDGEHNLLDVQNINIHSQNYVAGNLMEAKLVSFFQVVKGLSFEEARARVTRK